MENFFYEEDFYSNLTDFMECLEIENPNDLEDDWTCKIELTELEPIFKIDAKMLGDLLCDSNEDRLNVEFMYEDEQRILNAITESFDFKKFEELLPKYCYPTGNFKVLTKQDLINYYLKNEH